MAHIDECRKFVALISAYIDGELEGEVAIEFNEHLERCEKARVLVRTFERTIVLHRSSSPRSVPPELHRRLLAAIEECRNGEK